MWPTAAKRILQHKMTFVRFRYLQAMKIELYPSTVLSCNFNRITLFHWNSWFLLWTDILFIYIFSTGKQFARFTKDINIRKHNNLKWINKIYTHENFHTFFNIHESYHKRPYIILPALVHYLHPFLLPKSLEKKNLVQVYNPHSIPVELKPALYQHNTSIHNF